MPLRAGVALVLIGASVAGSVFMGFVATESFGTIDRLLAAEVHPSFHAAVESLGRDAARGVLRYLASELNRLLFLVWGWADVALLGAVLGLLWSVRVPWVRYAALGALALALVMALGLTPPIVSVGRGLDFVPREPPPPDLARFGLLHAGYAVLDAVKLVLTVAAAIGLVRSVDRPRSEVSA